MNTPETSRDSFNTAGLYLMFGVACGLGLDLCAKWLLADYSLEQFVFLRSTLGLITFLAISRWYGGLSRRTSRNEYRQHTDQEQIDRCYQNL